MVQPGQPPLHPSYLSLRSRNNFPIRPAPCCPFTPPLFFFFTWYSCRSPCCLCLQLYPPRSLIIAIPWLGSPSTARLPLYPSSSAVPDPPGSHVTGYRCPPGHAYQSPGPRAGLSMSRPTLLAWCTHSLIRVHLKTVTR
jgi:hypothetical protein